MAAKQGMAAHFSQATDDAKRAMIARAPTAIVGHSWLSNLNTTCTIKSAPPRSPEVMTMLASKAGWLVKRNEQHVWQRRWCCVVPHTFLYYFEAAPHVDGDHHHDSGGGVSGFFPSTSPSTPDAAASAVVENQDMLNAAVRDGLGGIGAGNAGDGGADGDERYYAAAATEGEMAEAALADPRGPTAMSGSNLQPVGIIDLECYSNVNRTNRSEGVMELTGDPVTNPDLRSFYFQAANAEDAEEWTNAFLTDRHSSLKDELEAIREVCDTFPLQLRECADMIDRAEEKAATSEKELYRVRSAAEEGRRRALELVRDILERRWVDNDAGSGGSPRGGGGGGNIKKTWSADESGDQGQLSAIQRKLLNGLEADRASFLEQLEEALRSPESVGTMNGGVLPAMKLLGDFVSSVVTSYASLGDEIQKAEKQVSSIATVDKSSLDAIQAKYDQLERKSDEKEVAYQKRIAELEDELKTLQESHAEVENHLQQSRMEFTMYQSQSKAKMGEASQHKKILKKEVIELRKRIEDTGSEADASKHEADRLRTDLETERQRNATLERYIERIEKQMSNQQDMVGQMMEVMSQTGSIKDSSILGKVVGPAADGDMDGARRGMPPSASASPSVDRSHRKNRLPRSFQTPSKQTPRSVSERGSGGLLQLHDEDEIAPREEDTTHRSGSLDADTEQGTEPLTSTTFGTSDVHSPLSGGADTPRKPAITLDDEPVNDGNIGDQIEELGINVDDADEAGELDEFNERSATPRNGTSGGSPRRSRKTKGRSRSQRYKQIMDSKREELAAKPRAGPKELTDADLHDEIQAYEQSGQHVYGASGYDDDYDDAKSHMSDITEDRTYKLPYHQQAPPRVVRQQERPHYVEGKRPKAPRDRGGMDGDYGDQQSATASSAKKLSVAERARMDAQRSSNSVTVRASPANSPMRPARGRSDLPRRMTDNESSAASSYARSRSNSPSVQSKRSFFARVGTRVVTAIDNSVLGVPNEAVARRHNDREYDDRSESEGSESSGSYEDESGSEESSVDDEQSRQMKKETLTPLAERQRQQREKQLEFLKQQGLLKDGTEGSLRGGPGAVSVEKKKKKPSRSPRSPSLSSRKSDNAHDVSFESAGH